MTDQNPNCFEEEGLTEFQSLGSAVASLSMVMGDAPEGGGFADAPQPSEAGGAERRDRKGGKNRRKKKGGWRKLTGMTIAQAGMALNIFHAARRARVPLNYLVSINPAPVEGESLADRRKRIGRYPERIRAGLKRRGQDDIAVTAWQWPVGGLLHAHMLVHVAPENDDYMPGWVRGEEVHIRKACSSDIGYIIRERLPGKPSWEAKGTLPRVAGTPLKGQRLSASNDAKRLVALATKKRQVEVVPEPTREPIIWASDPRGQFLLFGEPPVLTNIENYRGGKLPPPVAEQLEARRRQLGLTQEELAALAGISRPQISNVVAGRFGLSRDAAERLQAVLKEAA